MAKYSVWAGTNRSIEIRISRADFIGLVQAGIDRVRREYDDLEYESIQPEVLLEIARTTDRCDANTWRAINSCGCPMVKAGRVSTVDMPSEAHKPPTAIIIFTKGYDNAANNWANDHFYHSGGKAQTFIITD